MLTVLILVITLALATLGIWGMISIAISGWLDGDEESLDARLDETCKKMFPASAPIAARGDNGASTPAISTRRIGE
jgi:hypothetical protein